ncbi:hypothetical protein ACFLUQ_01850 [Chloroflexota bacterium]
MMLKNCLTGFGSRFPRERVFHFKAGLGIGTHTDPGLLIIGVRR